MVTLAERQLDCELRGRRILWLSAVAALQIASILGVLSDIYELDGLAGRRIAFALGISLFFTGASIFYCLAEFDKVASVARMLLSIEPSAATDSINSHNFTSEQIEALKPSVRAWISYYLLIVLIFANAILLGFLVHSLVFGNRKTAASEIDVVVQIPQVPPVRPTFDSQQAPDVNVSVQILRNDSVVISEFDSVYFGVDEADGPEIVAQVDRIADRVKQRQIGWPCEVFVDGHADSQGPDDYNSGLADKRTEVVTRLLAERLPETSVFPIGGTGERRLSVLTGDEADQWANRRVDVVTQCRG